MKSSLQKFSIVLLCFLVLAGCSSEQTPKEEEKIKIVVTMYPQYDWIKQIIGDQGDQYEVILLTDQGIDMHNYQPSVEDVVHIQTSDLFIYVGGESESWVEEVLAESMSDDRQVVCLVEELSDRLKVEEVVEGMEEEDHGHEQADHHDDYQEDEDHDQNHEHEVHAYDEHILLSLDHAKSVVSTLSETLQTINETDKTLLQANAADYIEALDKLDESYKTVFEAKENKTIMFADRFPFRYLVDDYGLEYYAAFPGCSTDSEASFETITFLTDKLNTSEIPTVFILDHSDASIAEAIIRNSDSKQQGIVAMYPMETINLSQSTPSYLTYMRMNLENIAQVLN